MRATALGLIAFAHVVGAGPGGPAGESDRAKVQGTWRIVGGEHDGAPLVPAEVKAGTVVITADRLTIRGRGPDETTGYTLDPAKRPRAIDLTDAKAKDTRPGIYELDGDRLRLCFRTAAAKAPGERPTVFGTGPKRDRPGDDGPGLMLLILDRQK